MQALLFDVKRAALEEKTRALLRKRPSRKRSLLEQAA